MVTSGSKRPKWPWCQTWHLWRNQWVDTHHILLFRQYSSRKSRKNQLGLLFQVRQSSPQISLSNVYTVYLVSLVEILRNGLGMKTKWKTDGHLCLRKTSRRSQFAGFHTALFRNRKSPPCVVTADMFRNSRCKTMFHPSSLVSSAQQLVSVTSYTIGLLSCFDRLKSEF